MKRKNLILSLVCSILVAVTMISFTVYSLVSPTTSKNKGPVGGDGSNVSISGDNVNDNKDDNGDNIVVDENINELRDGSEELPYVLYSASNFVEMLTTYGSEVQPQRTHAKEQVMVEDPETGAIVPKYDEEGKPVYTFKLDEEGKYVYDYVLDEQGNKVYVPYYFELAKNIDFKDFGYTTLFNNGKAFKGIIDGNGFKIKNIEINVTVSDFESKFSFVSDGYRVAHIALFGDVEGATIKDLELNNMSVNVDEAVHSFVSNVEYDVTKGFYREIVVGTVAGFATDSTFENVVVNANVNGFAYAIYTTNKAAGYNAFGGLVAVADGLTVKGCEVNANLTANVGFNYYVGGVAAYATGVTVSDTKLDVAVNTSYARKLTVGGMFVVADTITVEGANVEFDLIENAATASDRDAYVAGLNVISGDTVTDKANNNDLRKAAGVVVFLNTKTADQKSTFDNVSVVANVDYDCIYAGVILDVETFDKTNKELVKLNNVYASSNVNVLVAYGYARQLISATVTFDANSTAHNIVLTGNTKLVKYFVTGTTEQEYSATLFTYKDNYKYLTVDIKALRIKITTGIAEKLGSKDNLRIANDVYGVVDY